MACAIYGSSYAYRYIADNSIRRRQHAYRRLLCEGRGSALHNRRIGGAYPYGRLRLSGGENICGLKESEGHTHNESCYTYVEDEKSENEETETSSNAGKKELVCSLDEQEGHTHTADCVCPGGEYICGLEESEGHTHSEDCYAQGGELICTADKEDEVLSAEEENGNIVKASSFSDIVNVIQNLKDSELKKKRHHSDYRGYCFYRTDYNSQRRNGNDYRRWKKS